MKKIVVGIILIITIIGIYKYVASNKKVMSDNSKEHIKSNDMLTMMIETEAGTGIYKETTASEWPTDGYVFNETLSKCENGSELSWDNNLKKVIFASTKADKCYIYFDIKKDPTFADYIIDEVYSVDGTNGLYYHDGQGTYTNANQEAGDNSYRYSGANPNNYVCFGSEAATCPEENLYRIIGLFDADQDGNYSIKLVKADYANSNTMGTNGDLHTSTYIGANESYYKGSYSTINSYYWNNNTKNNNWAESNLNKINLNTNYWNSMGSVWQEKIKETEWKIRGNTTNNIYSVPVKTAYQNEIINPVANTIYKDEIGLMYVSDYGYAASPENWLTNLDSYDTNINRNNNWLFMGIAEWTITRQEGTTNKAFGVRSVGTVYIFGGEYGAARPVFNLKEEVKLASGTGSKDSPYRINMEKAEGGTGETNQTATEYIINTIYTSDGTNGLYYHDGQGTYTNANQEAGDNSYRYSGANPDNYVCFGSDAATCPEDNLYRIIGLFDDNQDGIYNIKLIKSTSYGSYAWDSGISNTWNETKKPDIYTTFNTTFWNTLRGKWQGLIDNTYQWQVGGMIQARSYTAKQYYDAEIKNQIGYEETMGVGLMYLSDYGYATSPDNWQTALYDYDDKENTTNNWLYLGTMEWTISRRSESTITVFDVNSSGGVVENDAANGAYAVRPSFYIKPEVVLEGGTGSASDPFRITD